MLLNYIKLAFRLMTRNYIDTLINVSGLAVGFACFFALWGYATAELKGNEYHQDYERICRLSGYWRWTDDGGKNWEYVVFGFTKSDLPPRIKDDLPDVESYVRILQQNFFADNLVHHDKRVVISTINRLGEQQAFKETKVVYADSNLFDFFTIPLVYGQKDKVLSEPNYVVLSKTTAYKYFGNRNPVGEIVMLNHVVALKVSGVFEDLPHYTHLDFDMVISNEGVLSDWQTAFLGGTQNFFKLKTGSSFKGFESKIVAKKNEYWSQVLKTLTTVDIDMFIQPLKDIPFSKAYEGDEFTTRSKGLLIALASVSVAILIMALSNSINLTMARTRKRMKEFGARKMNGARASDLIRQFVTESVIIQSIAILLAITLLQFMRQPFKQLLNIPIPELSHVNFHTALFCLAIFLISILINALFPALLVSFSMPQSLFKSMKTVPSQRFLPALLTTLQFSGAVVLILWGYMVFLELNFILTKEIGIDRKDIVVVDSPIGRSDHYMKNCESLVIQLGKSKSIENVTYSNQVVGDFVGKAKLMRHVGGSAEFGFDGNGVRENFIPFFNIKLLAGRNFRPDDHSDVVILSRFASNRLGYTSPDSAIGARIEVQTVANPPVKWKSVEIIGVIDDYRSASMYEYAGSRSQFKNEIQSRGILLTYKNAIFEEYLPNRISFRIKRENLSSALPLIESEFSTVFPGELLSWQYLNDNINKIYLNERITRNQIMLFVLLAIGIACLGLLGMIANRANEKTKEIGIRKVLGAHLLHICILLLRTTLFHLCIAILIGLPVAYYLIQQYLHKFAERITMEWWHYALPILILVAILLSTIMSIVWKAARNNPVNALKYE